jgi:hypothetical protein
MSCDEDAVTQLELDLDRRVPEHRLGGASAALYPWFRRYDPDLVLTTPEMEEEMDRYA